MLRLHIAKEPRWLDLGDGVRVQVAPANSAMRLAALREVALAEQAIGADADEADRGMALAVAEAAAFARRAIIAWEGVADADGTPIEAPTPDQAAALMEQSPTCCLSFIGQYIAPMREVEQEKNASAPSPNGNTAGARATAPRARGSARTARVSSTNRKASKGSKRST